MCEWVETATEDEQLKNYKHVITVINDCNKILQEIKAIDHMIPATEILYGFKL